MFLIDPPRPLAERRRVAIRAALNLYEGPVSRRAKDLAASYRSYLASAWPREQALDELPDPRSTERTLLHRLARLNGRVVVLVSMAEWSNRSHFSAH